MGEVGNDREVVVERMLTQVVTMRVVVVGEGDAVAGQRKLAARTPKRKRTENLAA